jgi:small-conductance mechanosensitive channel
VDYIRKVGKYLIFVSIAIAVLHGIIYQKIFAPFEVSIACWIGILLWGIGFGGGKLKKYRAARSGKRLPARRASMNEDTGPR